MKISEAREAKAHASGDYDAYFKDQDTIRFINAKKSYLQAHPEVGTIMRDGVEIFYRNLEPYHLGIIEEFTPASVIKP